MQFRKDSHHAACSLAFLCFIGLLKVAASQSCDSVGTAGIEDVRSSPIDYFAEYGLFLNLENPFTCTGKATEFEYSFYKMSSSNMEEFEIQLSLWRPEQDGVYNKVYFAESTARVTGNSQGINELATVAISPPVYVESGDVVGLFMNEPTFMASLVDDGDDQICTSQTDTDILNCSMNVNRRLRVQAMFEPISCSVEGVSITNGTVLADGVVVMGSQSVGTVITYQCDPGYVLSGSTQRTCEIIQGSPNGEWSGLLPSCTEGVDIPESSLDATVSPSATTTPVPSSTGSVVAGVVVSLVILLLVVVAGSVGVVVFLAYRRKAVRLNRTGTTNQYTSAFDNPIKYISSLYRTRARSESENINGNPEYSEINTGTMGSFHTTKDLGIPDEAVGHYEVDCFSYRCDGDPHESIAQYEEPGAVFVTNTSGRVIRTPSTRGNETVSGSFTSAPETGATYYSSITSTSDYYKLLEEALASDGDIYGDDDDDDGLSRKKTIKYIKPAAETEALYMQLKNTKVKRIQADTITLLDHIGSGQYGNVHKAIWTTSNNNKIEVAVKKLKDGALTYERIKFLQEAAIMAQFSNPNVLGIMGVIKQEEEVMIIVELMSNGDLRDYLIQMRPKEGHSLPADTNLVLLGFCRQVCLGMTYLSGKGFVHRDLAARNILISSDRICKISDFGMARDLEDESYYFSQGGKIPVRWTAPEAINYSKYSTFSDVWSFGCLMYEIWSLGQKPYGALSHEEVVERVSSTYRLPPPPGCPRSQYETMINAWHPVPKKRPDFHDIMLLLLQHDMSVLDISKEALASHPEAGKLGAALVAGKDMYPDLQNKYENAL